MTARRLLVAGVVVALLVALVTTWGGRAPAPGTVDRPVVPVAGAPGELSSTWFCAAGALGPSRAARHTVLLTNPTDRPTPVRLSGHTPKGPNGTRQVLVGPASVVAVDVDQQFAPGTSVVVESPVAPMVVAHRLQADGLADELPCATASSDRWYFVSQTTVRGTSATLVLFNPFPVDAGADVRIALDGGVRSPRALSGLVVPAGQTRYVDLGQAVQRREQFSVTVTLRTGRLVAETVQVLEVRGVERGLRVQLGVPAAAERWDLAGGFTGPGVAERLVLFNPRRTRTTVLVQVTPYGAAEAPPEPFELEVPALRFVVLDLSKESRVPGVGYHSVAVEAESPVVVGRVNTLTGPPGRPTAGVPTRPPLASGTSVSTGSPVEGRRWVAPSVRTGPEERSVVLVHNASAGIALVSVSVLDGGRRRTLDGFGRVELAAGDGLVVPVGPAGLPAGTVGVEVASSTPVVVEAISTFDGAGDLATYLAVPRPTAGSAPVPLEAE